MKLIICVLLIFYMACSQENSDSDCIYDSSSLNDKFLKDKKFFKLYTWNDSSKTAKAITVEDDLVYISKWACEYYGLQAQLYLPNPNKDSDINDLIYIQKKLLFLAKSVLPSSYKQYYEKYISTKNFIDPNKSEKTYHIPNDLLEEFFIKVNYKTDLIILTITYSRA